MTISEIEALPASRLSELWLEQSLFDDRLFLRVGQLSADTEYMVSQTSILFTNGTFGWPAIFAANMTDGGPAYPLSAPTVRLKYVPTRELSFQASLIDGTPGGGNPRSGVDQQRRNPNGTPFPLSDPPLAIAEVSYAYNVRPGDTGLPGTVTFGGWHRFGRVDALMPYPLSGLVPRVSGDSGTYGVIDQTIYQEPNDPNDGASVFLRASASPGDRNLVDFYLDGGIAYRGLFPGRSDDTLGFGVGVTHISPVARRLDAIAALQSATPAPRRSAELLLEATYQAVLAPGIALQPTVQYVVHPGGGIASPAIPMAHGCTTPGCSACAPSPATQPNALPCSIPRPPDAKDADQRIGHDRREAGDGDGNGGAGFVVREQQALGVHAEQPGHKGRRQEQRGEHRQHVELPVRGLRKIGGQLSCIRRLRSASRTMSRSSVSSLCAIQVAAAIAASGTSSSAPAVSSRRKIARRPRSCW
ncbi:hypothetical protein PMNALOAF_2354 [Methylobacterium adhaesivum]|uniref:carbohydrate porin n=1 Tax=Methylobacterium adhaesivum TaxID=333297 RepID=UPI002086EE80|nr:hypothetical protein PMNALOAF_2354 [Methylobacterium adhaesivum]